MSERVAGVRIDRVQGRLARSEVVGVRGADPLPVPLGGLLHQPLRSYLADHPRDVAAQLVGDRQLAVAIAQEPHVVDPDGGRRRRLLGPPDPRDLRPWNGRVEAASVTVRDHQVRHLEAGRDEAGDRAGGSEVDVVGMGGDHEHAFDGGVVEHGGPSGSSGRREPDG